MTEEQRHQIKSALLQCAKENENRTYATFHIVVSSICRSAKERIEELEKQVEQMKNCTNCAYYKTRIDKCRECDYGSEWRFKRKDVIKEPANFPVVGEISEKEIAAFILGKIKKN